MDLFGWLVLLFAKWDGHGEYDSPVSVANIFWVCPLQQYLSCCCLHRANHLGQQDKASAVFLGRHLMRVKHCFPGLEPPFIVRTWNYFASYKTKNLYSLVAIAIGSLLSNEFKSGWKRWILPDNFMLDSTIRRFGESDRNTNTGHLVSESTIRQTVGGRHAKLKSKWPMHDRLWAD